MIPVGPRPVTDSIEGIRPTRFGAIIDQTRRNARARVGRQGDVIDRERVRKLAEKPLSPESSPPPNREFPRQALIEFLNEVEPDLKSMERMLSALKEAAGRPAGQFERLAAADGTGRYLGLRIIAEEQRALQARASDALEQARIHERLERARRRTRGRKSRPEIAGDDQRILSDRLGRARSTLETFVSESARMGEFV